MSFQRLLKSLSAVVVCVAFLALPWIAKPFGEGLKARIDEASETGFPAFHDYERDRKGTALLASGLTTTVTPGLLASPGMASPAAHMGWATWTATVAGTTTSTATSTTALPVPSKPPAPILDRLADGKPSIWGDKRLYVLLGFIYVTLFGLFLKQVISISKDRL